MEPWQTTVPNAKLGVQSEVEKYWHFSSLSQSVLWRKYKEAEVYVSRGLPGTSVVRMQQPFCDNSNCG